jgi:hypothetical protein
LVFHGFALNRLDEISNEQHDTLQNSNLDHSNGKPDAIGLLGPDWTVMATRKR